MAWVEPQQDTCPSRRRKVQPWPQDADKLQAAIATRMTQAAPFCKPRWLKPKSELPVQWGNSPVTPRQALSRARDRLPCASAGQAGDVSQGSCQGPSSAVGSASPRRFPAMAPRAVSSLLVGQGRGTPSTQPVRLHPPHMGPVLIRGDTSPGGSTSVLQTPPTQPRQAFCDRASTSPYPGSPPPA